MDDLRVVRVGSAGASGVVRVRPPAAKRDAVAPPICNSRANAPRSCLWRVPVEAC